jgi:hypothetical protein
MSELIARCGFQCHGCPAYKKNIKDSNDQRRVSEGWAKYYGFRMLPEKIRCDGCLTDDSESLELPDRNCPIRPCVLEKGLGNCAECETYPCDKLEQRMRDYEAVAKRHEGRISAEDHAMFIAPYDSRLLLNRIRERMSENESGGR